MQAGYVNILVVPYTTRITLHVRTTAPQPTGKIRKANLVCAGILESQNVNFRYVGVLVHARRETMHASR